MIWVHDIQLLMTPYYLKRKALKSNIGFFCHSPFPSSDIFKTMQFRIEILRSMLCCDVIGFHLFEYARNLYYTCRRMFDCDTVNLKGGFMGLTYNGRNILIEVNHIGINQEDIPKIFDSKPFSMYKTKLSQDVQQRRVVICAVDRLHPISGVVAKLEGYRDFLRNNATHRNSVCLIQILSYADI